MNLFSKACGATGPLQFDVECQGSPHVESLTYDMPFVLIGRDPRTDLTLNHRELSRRHVYLQMVSGHLFYVDLGSRIGTYLGDHCQRSSWVARGQALRVGPYRVRLVGGDDEESEIPDLPATEPSEPPPGPMEGAPALPCLILELSHRAIMPAVCRIPYDLTLVGSSPDCKVRLLDPSVSSYHCSLLRTPNGFWVVDLLGQGGVMVNGTGVRYARVYVGDELHVGHSLIRLRYEGQRSLMHTRQRDLPRNELPAPRPSGNGQLPAPGGHRGLRPTGTPGLPISMPSLPLAMLRPTFAEPAAPTPAWPATPVNEMGQFLEGQPSEKAELVESVLVPLANQFSIMQQQMFENFNQSMMTMFQMFAALQQEQVGALREELDGLRELTQELHTLQAELAAQKLKQQTRPAASPPRSTRPDSPRPAAGPRLERPAEGAERPQGAASEHE